MEKIISEHIDDLLLAANYAGFNSIKTKNEIELITWQAGINHTPTSLPKNKMAVYIFFHEDICLKVGKANIGSKPRYQTHHYYTTCKGTTLAKSLTHINPYKTIEENDVRQWIMENTTRYNILIDESNGSNFLNFVEAFFILKFQPVFEGKFKKLQKPK